MFSLYPEQYSEKVHALSFSQDIQARQIREMLSIAKFFVKNGELAIKELENNHLNQFDPLVRDRVCQRHTAVILSLIEEEGLKDHISILKPRLKEVITRIDRTMQKTPFFQNERVGFKDLMTSLSIDVAIDKRTQMLFFAHLLTIASSFQLDNSGRISYHIDYSKLRTRLSKSLSQDTIKEIVSLARATFSRDSAAQFPTVVEKLESLLPEEKSLLKARVSLTQSFLIDEGSTELIATNAFFCMEAVLKMASERQTPILIKEHRVDKNPKKKILFGSDRGEFIRLSEQVDPLCPIIVVQGIIPEQLSAEALTEAIKNIGLGEVILTNASLCQQFTTKDRLDLLDSEGAAQILKYREKAAQLQCTLDDLKLIHIVHVYPSTMKSEAAS